MYKNAFHPPPKVVLFFKIPHATFMFAEPTGKKPSEIQGSRLEEHFLATGLGAEDGALARLARAASGEQASSREAAEGGAKWQRGLVSISKKP